MGWALHSDLTFSQAASLAWKWVSGGVGDLRKNARGKYGTLSAPAYRLKTQHSTTLLLGSKFSQ